MRVLLVFIVSCFLNREVLISDEWEQPIQKIVVVGGGIIGALESYNAYLDAKGRGEKISVVVYEKGPSFEQPPLAGKGLLSTNTAYNIFPSLTPDEILSVVPRGSELVEKLAILFSEPGGIRTDDVPGLNDSITAVQFKEAVELYGKDPTHEDRTKSLLALGKMSMDLWQELYEKADDELKTIFEECNYNACRNPQSKDKEVLHDGYRIDLIYNVPNALDKAEGMVATYKELGYGACKVLSPDEASTIDPSLTHFCNEHSELDGNGDRKWKKDASSLWRPGGCISTPDFLPQFYAYLEKAMGTYVDANGKMQPCFTLVFNKEVGGVELDQDLRISSLMFQDGSVVSSSSADTHYVFCPGESVGTLRRCGFEEPAYAGFAGPALLLNIPLSSEQSEKYKHFNHCMEVHKVGVVLAWQARFQEDRLIIGVSGTKAFYGDELPKIDQDFAKNRNLLQLNMINDVIPELVSIGYGSNTKGAKLLQSDFELLKEKGILYHWVGRRAVAYDGFPTLGALYSKGQKVGNGRCTTHLGSGGVSFAPAVVEISRRCENIEDEFTRRVLLYADSRRRP